MALPSGHRTMPISTFVDYFFNGRIKIPDFQREFVWSDERVRQLAESILKGYPIGLLIFFNVKDVSYVLDGQQRILSLALIKNGDVTLRNGRRKSINLWFNVSNKNIMVTRTTRSPGVEWLKISDILRMSYEDIPEIAEEIERNLANSGKKVDYTTIRRNLFEVWETFNGQYKYHIPYYAAPANIGIEELGEIFVRINFAGTRIRAADIYLTMFEVANPGMASKIRNFRESLERKWVGESWEIDHGTLVKTFLAFLTDGKVKIANTVLQQADELRNYLRSQDNVERAWESTEEGITRAIELLREQLKIGGTKRSWLFLSEAPLITIAYYIGKRGFNLSDEEKKALTGWFLLAQFYHRYTSAPDTKLNEDLELAKNAARTRNCRMLIDKIWEFAGMKGITEETFSGRVTSRGNNLVMMLLALLQEREAKDFYRQTVNIDESQDLTIHHIFPEARLPSDYSDDEIHDIANITLTLASTNKTIGDKEPNEYLPSIPTEIRRQHLIPSQHLWDIRKYKKFLTERRKLLVKEINNYLRSLGVL